MAFAFGLCFAQIAFLVAADALGQWWRGLNGELNTIDYVAFWAAGRMILDGHAGQLYDTVAHKAQIVAVLGHDFVGYYSLYYPPMFFAVMAAFAALPYLASYVVWLALTFPPYLFVIRKIIDAPGALLLACAWPGLLPNILVGQNACISVALFGGALLSLPQRPILAGILFGLLTYKPQFGVLIPLALLCGGYWRAIVSAAVTAILFALLSWLVVSTQAWLDFLPSFMGANTGTLTGGLSDWRKLQSLFGVARVLGADTVAAWIVQGSAMLAAALWVCLTWSSRRAAFATKAATLAAAAVLFTPYIYLYDITLLALPVAYLLRMGWRDGFLAGELPGLAVAAVLIFAFPAFFVPVGALSTVIVAGLIARRSLRERRDALIFGLAAPIRR